MTIYTATIIKPFLEDLLLCLLAQESQRRFEDTTIFCALFMEVCIHTMKVGSVRVKIQESFQGLEVI